MHTYIHDHIWTLVLPYLPESTELIQIQALTTAAAPHSLWIAHPHQGTSGSFRGLGCTPAGFPGSGIDPTHGFVSGFPPSKLSQPRHTGMRTTHRNTSGRQHLLEGGRGKAPGSLGSPGSEEQGVSRTSPRAGRAELLPTVTPLSYRAEQPGHERCSWCEPGELV